MAGLAASFGSGAMTNSIAELEDSDCILVIGSNTTETHPVISTFIKRAARLKKKTLIVIEPRRIDLVRHAALWLRQRPGTDIAVINGIMNLIIQENLHDQAYIAARTENFEALKETVAKYTPEYVEQISGVPAADLRRAARLYGRANAAAIVYAMGITQHTTGTDNVKSLANLAMLCGNIGIKSGGVNPLRGQNNVQGACDMGGLPNVFSGYQPVTDAKVRAKMEAAWGVENLPAWVGLTMTDMVPAIPAGKIKALYIIGENPVVSDPDSDHLVKAFKQLDFLVVQDIFLTETAQLADVVLPATTFAEKEGTFSNTERRVSRVRQVIPPGATPGLTGRLSPRFPGAWATPWTMPAPKPSSRRFARSPPPMPASPMPAWIAKAACNGPAPLRITPAPFICTKACSPGAKGLSSPLTTATRQKCPMPSTP